ncbi:helix-turn-helix domain-containing protein [Streptomyces sp. NPDC048644]|uniref:helix-turn-helix domain-containing protein n=1 Tax=Streptomyces sp. NPDC048644 TaxID=3365582 RepID=UPI0037213349
MPPRKDTDASVSVPCFYGAELRFQREQAGLTLEQLVEGSFRGLSFLSQIERGERGMPKDLAVHVDKKLGTNGFFERHCTAVQKARLGGYAEHFADVADMEPRAATIEDWAPLLIPGLLQTAPYARVIMRSAMPWSPAADIERMVKARLKRADVFKQEKPPKLWVTLDENVIRRRALPPDGMAELMEHITRVIEGTPSILQIVPATAGIHPFMMGMTRIMTFRDEAPLIYTEGLHSGQLIDYPPHVTRYRESYDLLRAAALPPEASLAMIDEAARGYRNEAQQEE